MELNHPAYVLVWRDVREAPVPCRFPVILDVDRQPVAGVEDLEAIDGTPSVGYLQVLSSSTPVVIPAAGIPAGSLVDTPTRLVVSYLPGLRGAFQERGATLRRLTPAAWRSLRRRLRQLPELDTQEAIDSWARRTIKPL
ncbi:MAG: hypothetical protein ACPGQD_06535 [Planctomycetota bacterium]